MSGFGVVSVTYDFWPKAQAAVQASEYFRLLMIFGQKRRPRVRLRSTFGHLFFLFIYLFIFSLLPLHLLQHFHYKI